jgi:hypothetical protein
MLELRPDCERCGADLSPCEHGAHICSFECTFCADCADRLQRVCPNCGGELVPRPTRSPQMLAKYPSSSQRRFKRPGA